MNYGPPPGSYYLPVGLSPQIPEVPKRTKQRRVSRACDFCHKRSMRCVPIPESRCKNCEDFDRPCTFTRPVKRGATTSNSNVSGSSQGDHGRGYGSGNEDGLVDTTTLFNMMHDVRLRGGMASGQFAVPQRCRETLLGDLAKIEDLLNVYFEAIYPM